MKVLWLLNFIPPVMAKALRLPVQAGGSWVMALQQALQGFGRLELVLCAYANQLEQPQRRQLEGCTYLVLPSSGGKQALEQALQQEQPDLVQLFGTEFQHAQWLFDCFDAQRILVHIQGLTGPYAQHLPDGLPPRLLRAHPLRDRLAQATGGSTVHQLYQTMTRQGQAEQQLFGQVCHVLGRTQWDRALATGWNPQVQYHCIGEIMRSVFYEGGWQPRTPGCGPVLFVSQAHLPFKGLHWLIEALPEIRRHFPGVQVQVAGWPPQNKGLLQPVYHWLADYQGYLAGLARRLGVADCIHYTGVLDAAGMRDAFLNSDVFVMPSTIENSPNALGEAMLLGMPCIAAQVGGIPSMLTSGKEGLLFDPCQPGALAQRVVELLRQPQKAAQLGAAARQRALAVHDPAAIAQAHWVLYQQICSKEVQP